MSTAQRYTFAVRWFLALGSLLLIIGCSERSTTQTGGTLQPADLLPSSGEISGWDKSSSPGAYGEADDQTSLYNLIDGAAELYIQYGFVEAVRQLYDGTLGGGSAELELFISDQGDPTGAEDLFDEEQVVPAGLTPWECGDEAVIDQTLPFDIVIHLRADRFYVRVTIDKNGDEVTALITAQAFAQAVVAGIEG